MLNLPLTVHCDSNKDPPMPVLLFCLGSAYMPMWPFVAVPHPGVLQNIVIMAPATGDRLLCVIIGRLYYDHVTRWCNQSKNVLIFNCLLPRWASCLHLVCRLLPPWWAYCDNVTESCELSWQTRSFVVTVSRDHMTSWSIRCSCYTDGHHFSLENGTLDATVFINKQIWIVLL